MTSPADLRSLLTREPMRVRDGVADFVAPADDYCDNFGAQWNEFRVIQIDSLSGKSESHDRFFAETGWTADAIRGKTLLDAGCGAGRFAEVALEAGARVVAVDLSEAAYACAQTLKRFPSSEYLVIRGDLRDLPLKPASFDGVYSLGVLQHTPDPLASLAGLVPYLKPGGRIATWIYEKPPRWLHLLMPKTYIRALIARWPASRKLALARMLTALGFPFGWALSWLGRFGQRASYFLPYAARHHLARHDLARQWRYSVMDTFDWYGPMYEKCQTQNDVMAAMANAGLTGIRRLAARGMAIVGERQALHS